MRATFSYVAPIEASASTPITGVITQRALPFTERRTLTAIQVVSVRISGGHTQFSAVKVCEPGGEGHQGEPGGAHGDPRDGGPALWLPGAVHSQRRDQGPTEPEPEHQGAGDGGLSPAGEHPEDKHQSGGGAGDDGEDDGAPAGRRSVVSAVVPGAWRSWSLGWVWVLMVVS